MLVLARVRSKKKSPQRARLQSSTFGGFLDLVKISEIRSEVGPKSDRSRTEVGPMSDRSPDQSPKSGPKSEVGPMSGPKSDRSPARSRSEVRSRTEVGPILAAVITSGCFTGFGQGSIPLYERSTSLIQAQPGANRLVKGATSDYRMFCFGPVPTRNKAKFCPSLS